MNLLTVVLAVWVTVSTPVAADILHPAEEVVSSVTSRICIPVRQILKAVFGSSPPDLSQLSIVLYTPEGDVRFSLLEAAEQIPKLNFFNRENKVIFWLNSFLDSAETPSYTDIREAFMAANDTYVLALDTKQSLGLHTLYLGATDNVPYIGRRLGELLAELYTAGVNPSMMYLIGHSLGAHIAGLAGKTFRTLTGQLVGRITGLDPAGPCYIDINGYTRLTSTDAAFVDVIHSNAGVLGLDEQIGHTDFYPNGGHNQPHSPTAIDNSFRALQLYSDTVRFPQSMPAVSCYSWEAFKEGRCNYNDISLMGYACDPNTRGRYYLRTTGTEPFALGAAGMTYEEH